MPDEQRDLSRDEKRLVALLGLPSLGLALAVTVVSTYLPVLAKTFSTSNTVIGLIIAAEGLMALWVPLVAGTWSDHLRRTHRRLPFLLAGTPLMALSLSLMGFAPSLLAIALLVVLFFFAYFVAYEPYRALYPDLLGADVAGRSQGVQAVWRGTGTALALIGGGLLFSVGEFLPFLAGGVVLALTVGSFTIGMVRYGAAPGPRRERERRTGGRRAARATARTVIALLREQRSLRCFLIANGLWELSLAALKTFVILYITEGLGYSVSFASGVIGGVAIFILAGAVLSGRLADRMGASRVMEVALFVYGTGLLVPFFFGDVPLVVALVAPLVGFGGGVLMTLPFALLIPLMPTDQHGTVTGYYGASRGMGIMLGPVLAGAAIELLAPLPLFEETEGYAAMWGICAVAVLLSLPVLRRLRGAAQAERRS